MNTGSVDEQRMLSNITVIARSLTEISKRATNIDESLNRIANFMAAGAGFRLTAETPLNEPKESVDDLMKTFKYMEAIIKDNGVREPQDTDGHAHLAYFDEETQLGFVWDNKTDYFDVSQGGSVIDRYQPDKGLWRAIPMGYDWLDAFELLCKTYVTKWKEEQK